MEALWPVVIDDPLLHGWDLLDRSHWFFNCKIKQKSGKLLDRFPRKLHCLSHEFSNVKIFFLSKVNMEVGVTSLRILSITIYCFPYFSRGSMKESLIKGSLEQIVI